MRSKIHGTLYVCVLLTFLIVTSLLTSAQVTVFATGLNNPRGIKFGPDGYLYVAEGGLGGSISSVGQCDQVIEPVGPYTGDFTARISKISPAGTRLTVAEHLPSSQTSLALGSLISGVADVAFVGNTLYALLSGAGCSHGLAGTTNGIIKVNSDRTWTLIADLSVPEGSSRQKSESSGLRARRNLVQHAHGERVALRCRTKSRGGGLGLNQWHNQTPDRCLRQPGTYRAYLYCVSG